MIHVALTGNVASGKSTVGRLFQSWGATLIDADRLVRELQAPGSPVLDAIVRDFGRGVLAADGTLDRALLRRRVMADPASRRRLEALVHPAVHARRAVLVAEAAQRGDPVVVSDIPLLFETMDPAAFDAVVLVDAPEAVRRERLRRERGLSDAEADAMMASQMPSAAKRRWRGPLHVIDNDADLPTLERRARTVWNALTGRP